MKKIGLGALCLAFAPLTFAQGVTPAGALQGPRGDTIAVTTVPASALEALREDEVLSARTL